MHGFSRCRLSRQDLSDSGPSFATAAAIPIAFATAHYALVTIGRFVRGERVLIHSAAGGVGLAAVSIAQALRAEVLATAGSGEKRRYLHQRGVEHVLDSRSLAFADEVLQKTGGRGADVVLNSLSGAFLEKSLAVLAPRGRFVEIGKRDIYADTPLGLRALRNNAAFHAVDLAKLAVEEPQLLRGEIETVLAELGRSRFQMIPVTTFPVSKVTDAFRRMSGAEHIGKVVVSFDDKEALVHDQEPMQLPIASDATYLVSGGAGGFGLETGRWLVKNGARSLVLVGRSGGLTPQADTALNEMRSAGATVIHVNADVAKRGGALAALAAARRTGTPLRGIIHAAGAIDDALIADLTPERIRRVFDGKVLGAWHLHALTRSLPLDFFVLYSSVAATVGSPGQAHYAAANRMLDAIAAIRRARELPAISIAFGPIGDCGYLSRQPDVARYISGVGMQLLPAASALAALGTLLRHAPSDTMFADVNWSKLAQSFPIAATSPRLSGLIQGPATGEGGSEQEVKSAIVAAPEAQKPRVVTDYLRRKVAAVLKVEAEAVELERPLHEIGLDSLTAFELKNRIETDLGITLPIGKFLQRPTVSAIVPAIMAAINTTTQVAAQSVDSNGFGPSMTIGQEALWLVNRFDPDSPAYGLAACVAFRPHINEDYVDRIIQDLVLRHENLRIAFPSDGMGPVATVLPPELYKLNRHDATELTDDEFSKILHAEANKSFNVDAGPLSRLHLFRRMDRDVVLLQFHHIVADAASIAILLDEVLERYFALQAGFALPAPGQRAPFGQFVAWQRNLAAGPDGERHRSYWRQALAGAPPALPLPTDNPRSSNPLGPGAARNFVMKGIVVEELKGLARAEGTTLFSLLLAAFNVLLHHHTGAPTSSSAPP
jgi:epothilone polyketide synthase D